MRFSLGILAAVVSVAATIIPSTPVRRELSLNPPTTVTKNRVELISNAHIGKRWRTNAERLAQGLPPKPPRRRFSSGRRDTDPAPSPKPPTGESSAPPEPSATPEPSSSVQPSSAIPSSSAPPPSATPMAYAGRIQVFNRNTNAKLGYIYKVPVGGSMYGLTLDDSSALKVEFVAPVDGVPFDIRATNGIQDFPTLGGIAGDTSDTHNLGPDTVVVALLGGVSPTPVGSDAVVQPNAFGVGSVESAIWMIDPDTFEVKVQWINDDGSAPATQIAYNEEMNVLMLSGDIDEYNQAYSQNNPVVKLVLVQEAAVLS